MERIVLRGAVDLVGDEQNRGAPSPQERADLGVERGRAEPAVDDEEHELGFDERGLGLQENLPPERDVVPSQAAGVDDAERTLASRDDP